MGERPRLLDLFSGAGGAAMGYAQAGFDVTGIDNRPQPRYPFAFIQADALEYLREHGHDYDAIHASPPCHCYSSLKPLTTHEYADLLPATRDALLAAGWPWVIENVVGAPYQQYVQLCGTMFGLRVYRHRRFESGFFMFQPAHPKHLLPAAAHRAPSGRTRKEAYLAGEAFASVTGNAGSCAGPGMGIGWMVGRELSQAIPPAYTRYIGTQLMRALERD